jgi:hypothetical protein
MEQRARPSWTDAELAALLAEYFGEKLSPPQLDRLTSVVRAALADRSARMDASQKGLN